VIAQPKDEAMERLVSAETTMNSSRQGSVNTAISLDLREARLGYTLAGEITIKAQKGLCSQPFQQGSRATGLPARPCLSSRRKTSRS